MRMLAPYETLGYPPEWIALGGLFLGLEEDNAMIVARPDEKSQLSDSYRLPVSDTPRSALSAAEDMWAL